MTTAILDRDAAAVRATTEQRLWSGVSDEKLLLDLEPQRSGLLARYGEAAIRAGFSVDSIEARSDGAVVVRFSVDGKNVKFKSLVFVREDGTYRWAGAGANLAEGQSTIDGTTARSEITAKTQAAVGDQYPYPWRIHNFHTTQSFTFNGGTSLSALRGMGPRLLKTIPPGALTPRDGYFVPDVMRSCPV